MLKTFHVYEAQDCESIREALKEVSEAKGYDPDFAAELLVAKSILEQRRKDLGCLD